MVLPSREVLSRLACDDPQAFEDLRNELVENRIRLAPEGVQLRLRQLQFRIDGIRRRSGSPLSALIKIQDLMWESFLRMDQELQRFARPNRNNAGSGGEGMTSNRRPARSARIIEFRPRLPVITG
jgi:hypothetical protein